MAGSGSLELRLQPDSARYCAPRFLEDVTLRGGERTAIRFAPGDGGALESLSYPELHRQSRALARGLIAAGVVKGARVGVLMANRPEWVVASFAVGLCGAVLVPVNTFATPVERDYILRHSDTSLLLMQRTLLRRDFVEELGASHPEIANAEPGRIHCAALPFLRRVVVLGAGEGSGGIGPLSELLAEGESVPEALLDAAASEVVPSDDGVVIYTSGTTAHPKGVLHRQRAPVIQSWRFAEYMELVPEDVVWTAQPFFWTAGMTMSLGAALGAGATLLLQETFEPGAALAMIEEHRATTLHAWPHQEKALAEHPSLAERDISCVRKIEFASPLRKHAGIEKDTWGTYGSYGLSETFTLSSALPASASSELRTKTSGPPLPGMSLRIVDPETGEVLREVGAKGEVAVKGATLMAGYYKVEPELYLDDDGYFHTQDGGSFDAEGYLHWTGRLGNLIKTGGANVSPMEIERALAADPEIRVGLAVGVPHPVLGEVIVLCAVRAEGVQADDSKEAAKASLIREQLRSSLAAYKVPKCVLFFDVSEVELTANQKIQVGPLREAALARLQQQRAELEGVRYEPPDAAADTG